EWHEKLAKSDFKVKVLPAFRPDGVFSKDEDARNSYIRRLGEVSGVSVSDIKGIKKALKMRLDHFEAHGCKVADHGMENIPKEDEILEFLAEEYAKRGWVMQLHYGVIRNINTKMYELVGKDSGFDAMTNVSSAKDLACFLDRVEKAGTLPKTVIYSLNPEDNAYIDAIAGSFQRGPVPGKIQHGAAWWFNDHKKGIEDHLKTYAAEGVLGNFIGMLTDSRSFISYPRHDYFRRILCNLIGTWVEAGEYPNDEKALAELIRGICYENVRKYLDLAK
ncbi:MAG: glucuronate isomerase, partial [Lachnospiraceae bacterium]|nr:glucuronate isomerase [Lachnospiraceae bacterium]